MIKNETISEKLSRFIVKVVCEDIPESVVHKTKLVILDTLGCIIAAAGTEKGKVLANYFSSISCEGKATILGISKHCSPEIASFANGALAHMLEYDDGHRPSDNHNACVVVPAALAGCEFEQRSGTDFLTAVIIGYEIMGRVGRSVLLPRMGQAFHGTGTCGTFGAAAAAGKLMRLNKKEVANALGIAGTASAGLREVIASGFDSKALHAGRAAFNGVMASYLASQGIEGPRAVFEGEYGFCRAMTPEFDFDPILSGLSTSWEITYSGFKRHATCGITFTAVDSVLDIMEENHLNASEIMGIKVGVPSRVLSDEPFTIKAPKSTGESRFSIVYAVAVATLDGQVGLNQIRPDRIEAPDLKKMIERIELVHDKEAEEVDLREREKPMFFPPASVELTSIDGRHFRQFRAAPVGYDPIGSPLSSDEVISKFKGLVSNVLPADQVQSVINIVLELEGYKELGALSVNLSQ